MFAHKNELEKLHSVGGPGASEEESPVVAKTDGQGNAVGLIRTTDQLRQKWRNMVDRSC